ncbi:MAG: right-handed parallel beta-helix repeat-containing protein [Candidatus Omnitrophica bacterium]|nr:right-handed parallel beta-helix repeat-containing protein [Candidatus Omnitrophota bacterium]
MKSLNMKMTHLVMIASIMIAISFMGGGLVYANGNDDNTDRLTSNQSYTFSPGYINAAKQQTDAILRQESPKKSLFDRAVEYVQSKLAHNIKEDTNTKVTPNLQMRTGSDASANTLAPAANAILTDSTQYNVAIGSGANQEYDGSRLISEVINGRRHVYAGFDDYGTSTIQNAIDKANAGDLVVVRGKDFTDTVEITMKDGVSMYGGYKEDGTRDLSKLTSFQRIGGVEQVSATDFQNYTEFSGFRLISFASNMKITNASNFVLSDNYFTSSLSAYSSNILIQNNRFGNSISISGGNVSIISNQLFSYGIAVSGGTALVKNNYMRGSGWGIAALSGASVISNNNNFVGGLYANSGNITSTNDYFAGNPIYTTNNANGICSINSVSAALNTLAKAADTKVILNSASSAAVAASTFDSERKSLIESRMWDKSYNLKEESNLVIKNLNTMDPNTVTGIFKGLLSNKDKLTQGANIPMDPNLVIKLAQEALSRSAMAINGHINMQEAELAMALASILNNPTEDQKVVLKGITALLTDISKVAPESGQSLELFKAQNELLQMVVNTLLSQAIPDLLKEGDISGIKGIFEKLDIQKSKIMLDYQTYTTPYYESVKKDLIKNMSALQLNNVLLKGMLEEELKNVSRSDIDIIIAKLKKLEKKTFETGYILQQEAKYRKDYLDPNKKKLEDDMKGILQDATKKLNRTLEDVAKK